MIALVYNVKAEAPTDSSLVRDLDTTLTEALSPSLSATGENNSDVLTQVDRRTQSRNDVYAEWDTMETINAVRFAIEERFDVMMIEANEDAFEKLRESRPAFVFNIAEGLHGVSREAQIPAMLDMLQIPYLGSEPLTLGICLDKARAKEILSYHNIRTAGFIVVTSMDEFEDVRVKFPAMVKPLHEGSSKGIYNSCVVRNTSDLEREVQMILEVYKQPALIEDFLPGREFTVGVLGNGSDARTLPIVEIKFDALPPDVNRIYSYEAKWIWDQTENPLDIFECPANIDLSLSDEISTTCLDAYRVLQCRDWSRIDVRLDANGKPNIIEVNPLPGILPKVEENSCLPKAARAAGLSYNELINAALDAAMKRCGVVVTEKAQKKTKVA